MNIFVLSLDPAEIAEYMMDKHVSKILLEIVQMLCTAKRVVDPTDSVNDQLYKLAHKNHPVTIWCRKTLANFMWAMELVDVLHKEWIYRYDHPETKIHKAYEMALLLKKHIPASDKFEETGLTTFALAMPDKYKTDDPIVSYRNYYMSDEKQKIATWNKKRSRPTWYTVLAK